MTAESVPQHIIEAYEAALTAGLKARRVRVAAFNAALIGAALVLWFFRDQGGFVRPLFYAVAVVAVLAAILSAFVLGLDRSSNRAFYGTLYPALVERVAPRATYEAKPGTAKVLAAGLFPRLATTLVPWRVSTVVDGHDVELYGVHVFDNKRRSDGASSNLFDGVQVVMPGGLVRGDIDTQQLRTWGKPSMVRTPFRELDGDGEVRAFVLKDGPIRVAPAVLDLFNRVRAARPGHDVLLCTTGSETHVAVGQKASVKAIEKGDVSEESIGKVASQIEAHLALAELIVRAATTR